jgi:hypothetical protein
LQEQNRVDEFGLDRRILDHRRPLRQKRSDDYIFGGANAGIGKLNRFSTQTGCSERCSVPRRIRFRRPLLSEASM